MCINYNLFEYCCNTPIIYADFYGFEEISVLGHKIIVKHDGFETPQARCFLFKDHALKLAKEIIRREGENGKYLGMDDVRIATEVLAHQVLYYLGIGASLSSIISQAAASNATQGVIAGLLKLQAWIFKHLSTFLISSAKDIYVNYDEGWLRMFGFNMIWKLMPSVNGRCINQGCTISLKTLQNPRILLNRMLF